MKKTYETLTEIAVKNVIDGDYVKRKADAKTVYIRCGYDRSTKTYCLQDTEDMNRCIYIKSNKTVFVGFDY